MHRLDDQFLTFDPQSRAFERRGDRLDAGVPRLGLVVAGKQFEPRERGVPGHVLPDDHKSIGPQHSLELCERLIERREVMDRR